MDSAKYARHIGRVGALAVVLGVGAAVATTPGIAFAEPSDAGPSSASDAGNSDDTSSDPAKDSETASATQTSDSDGESETGAGIGSGGAQTTTGSAVDTEVDESSPATADESASLAGEAAAADELSDAYDEVTVTPEAGVSESPENASVANSSRSQSKVAQHDSATAPSSDASPPAAPSSGEIDTDDDADATIATTNTVQGKSQFDSLSERGSADVRLFSIAGNNPAPVDTLRTSLAQTEDATMGLPDALVSMATTIVGALFAPFLAPGPAAPAEPPLLWAILGFVRREIQRTLFNHTPDAVDITQVTDEDTPLTIDVRTSVEDAEDDAVSVTSFTQPLTVAGTTAGTLVQNRDGTLTFTPAADFNGVATFDYTVRDQGFNLIGDLLGLLTGRWPRTDTATVTVTVEAVNDAPVAADDAATVAEDGQASGKVLENDSDVDTPKAGLTAALATQATHGTAVINADGTYTYKPNANFAGSDSFTYTVSDGALSDEGTVRVTVTPVDDDPVGTNDSYATDEDTPLTVAVPGVLGNDTDADGDPLSVAVKSPPANGSVTLNPNGSFTYTPKLNFNGSDSFIYTVSDGDDLVSATVNITVRPVEDPTIAGNDVATVAEDSPFTTIDVFANDSDPDGRVLTINAIPEGPDHGTVMTTADGKTLTYKPAADFHGNDTFTYSVSDGVSEATATVTVTVTDVPEAEVVQTLPLPAGQTPTEVAVETGGKTGYIPTSDDDPNTPDTITIIERDDQSDDWRVAGGVKFGSNPGSVILDRDRGYVINQDDGTLSAWDLETGAEIDTDASTPDLIDRLAWGGVTDMAIQRSKTTTADLLWAVDASGRVTATDTRTFREVASTQTRVFFRTEAAATSAAEPIPLGSPKIAVRPDGERVYVVNRGRISVVENPRRVAAALSAGEAARGSAEQELNVVEGPDLGGEVTELVMSPDGGRLYATVMSNGRAQLAVLDTRGERLERVADIDLVGTGRGIAISDDSNRAYITGDDVMSVVDLRRLKVIDEVPTGRGLGVTFVPELGGVLVAKPDAVAVAILRTPLNKTVAVNPDSATVDAGSSVEIDVLANDVGGGLSPEVVAGPSNGTVFVNEGGDGFIYTPDSGFSGQDAFTYTANNETSFGNVATVTVTVNDVNQAPDAVDDDARTGYNNAVIIHALANDEDPDSELAVTSVTQGANGSVTIDPDGTLTYRPNATFSGTDTFSYTVSDGVLSDAAQVVVTVTPPITITLKWGLTPRDLDAHLLGPSATSPSGFHVFYDSPIYNVDGTVGETAADRAVFMSADDIDGFGPETTQINTRTDGTYLYYVNNFGVNPPPFNPDIPVTVTVHDPLNGPTPTTILLRQSSSAKYWVAFRLTIEDGVVTITQPTVDEFDTSVPTLEPDQGGTL